MKALRSLASAALLSAVLATPGSCQAGAAFSDSVEVIGLRRWSVPMLRDSLRRIRPDLSLGDAACGEVLRDSLGFPDAAVLRFRDGRVVLTLVEPGEEERVVLLPRPTGPPAATGRWLRLRDLAGSEPLAVEYAVATFFRHSAGEAVSVDVADSAAVEAVWSLLADTATRSDTDRQSAVVALTTDPDAAVRRAAAEYLLRYPDTDSTWHALLRALRDPDWSVRSAANGSLRSLRLARPRTVDWRPAAHDLRHLLDGTTLVFHTEVARLLLATSVDPDLAREILSAAGVRLLLEQSRAAHEYVRVPARELLERLSEIDPRAEPER